MATTMAKKTTSRAGSKGPRLDIDLVRQAATGRWPEIPRVAGISADVLDGRHHPCPAAGPIGFGWWIRRSDVLCNSVSDHETATDSRRPMVAWD